MSLFLSVLLLAGILAFAFAMRLAAKSATPAKLGDPARLRRIAELAIGGWSAPDYSVRNSVDLLLRKD